jgi:hypothetical protein
MSSHDQLFITKDGYQVRVSVEQKSDSGIFEKDFVSDGLHDFYSRTRQWYWIIDKPSSSPSKLSSVLSEAVFQTLGSYPATLPESKVCHLAVLLWEGRPTLTENVVIVLARSNSFSF